MLQKDKIILALLHTAGCTQADLCYMFENIALNPEEVLSAFSHSETLPMIKMTIEKRNKIQNALQKISLQTIQEIIKKHDISIIKRDEESYPDSLKNIAKSPYILYTRGNIHHKNMVHLGVVGSRKYTVYGENILKKIFSELPSENICIISGGALGIDSIAHKLAIQYKMPTISVFGCGIDIFYPTSNVRVFEEILENNGGLISIFPLKTRPEPYNFPIRNEIVAGLSTGVLIPEAQEKSGTLITAGLALDQGKEIFAVPGDIFKQSSAGCNQLIAKGTAKFTLEARDILEEYFIQIPTQQSIALERTFDNPTTQSIYTAIHSGINTPNSIGAHLDISTPTVLSELTLLELQGAVRPTIQGTYECIFHS